ncbi:MAG: hypothetical protein LBI95_03765 [Holosporales bacterium]|nr:hypothetical protein [Holosporales bacterium]
MVYALSRLSQAGVMIMFESGHLVQSLIREGEEKEAPKSLEYGLPPIQEGPGGSHGEK